MKRSKIKQANFIKSVRRKLGISLALLHNSILAHLFLFLAFTFSIKAQVGIVTDSPGSSSILELQSQSRGFLLPKINDVDKIKIPVEGLLIYNLKEHCVSVYKNKKWNCLNINSQSKPISNPIIYIGDTTQAPYIFINKVYKKENNAWTTISISAKDLPKEISNYPIALMTVENGVIYGVFGREIWKKDGVWKLVTNTQFKLLTSIVVNEGVTYIVDSIGSNRYCIYVINNGTSTLKYTLSDSEFIRIALEGQLLYIVEVGAKKIFQYDLSAKTTALKDVSGTNIPNLSSTNQFSMEDVDNGIIYIANNTQIWKKGVTSNTWENIGAGKGAPTWSNISGIKVKEGVIYVVDKQLKQVWKKDSSVWTNISGSFTFSNPMGIAVDLK